MVFFIAIKGETERFKLFIILTCQAMFNQLRPNIFAVFGELTNKTPK